MGNLLLTDLLLFPNFGKITGSKLERIQIRVYCVCACGSWRYVCYADRSLYAVVPGKETLWLLYKESGVVLSLSHGVRDKKNCFQFLLHTKPVCSDGLRAGTIESHNFFVLGPILVKFHIRTRLIESFRTIFRTWWCGEEKLHFTPVHTLRQLKRNEALIPPLRRVVGFRARYG